MVFFNPVVYGARRFSCLDDSINSGQLVLLAAILVNNLILCTLRVPKVKLGDPNTTKNMALLPLQGRVLTVAITMTCGFSFMLFGWDQGVFGGILNDPTFANQFKNPNPTIQGQIVSTYDIGCIIGAIISIYFGDKLGRRKSIAMSCAFVIVGGLLQASSFSLPHMIVGRIIAGLGIGQSTAVVPMWQAETSKAEHRGKLVALQMVMVIFGIDLTSWINLGMTYIYANEVSWRFPIAMQCFWAFVTLGLLACTVESPRWLCYKERHEEAQMVLARLAAKDREDPSVKIELKIISDAIAAEKAGGAIGWREVFSGGEQQNFRRLVLGAGASVFQQMGGINVVSIEIQTDSFHCLKVCQFLIAILTVPPLKTAGCILFPGDPDQVLWLQ